MAHSVSAALFFFIIFLGAFFGWFFAKNYPEIRRTQYRAVDLQVRQANLGHRYCCGLKCTCPSAANFSSLASCSTILPQAGNGLSPVDCAAGKHNQCPAATTCDGGRFCCNICCGSRCSCCYLVEQSLCQIVCNVCYRVNLTTVFLDRKGGQHTTIVSEDFGRSLQAAEDYLGAHPLNSTIRAYYKPDDPSVVIYSRKFTPRKWGLLVLFALPLQIATFYLTLAILSHAIQSGDLVVTLNWVMWVGIIWPFIILLPILLVGYVTPHWHTALIVLIPTLAVLGWFPLLLHRRPGQ